VVVKKIVLIVLEGLLQIVALKKPYKLYSRCCYKLLVTINKNEQITHEKLLKLFMSVCRVVPVTF